MAKIAIIDDDRKVERMLRSILNQHSVEIVSADYEGLSAALGFKPEIVICDYGESQAYGADVLLQCRKSDPPVACILTKSNPDPDIVEIFLDLGIFEFLNKPIDPEELLRVINQILSRSTDKEKRVNEAAVIPMHSIITTSENIQPVRRGHSSLKREAQEAQYAEFISKVKKFKEDNRQ